MTNAQVEAPPKDRFKETMLKSLAREAAARSRRNHRTGLVLGAISVAILYGGVVAIPFAIAGFALAAWALKDAYAADEQLQRILKRM